MATPPCSPCVGMAVRAFVCSQSRARAWRAEAGLNNATKECHQFCLTFSHCLSRINVHGFKKVQQQLVYSFSFRNKGSNFTVKHVCWFVISFFSDCSLLQSGLLEKLLRSRVPSTRSGKQEFEAVSHRRPVMPSKKEDEKRRYIKTTRAQESDTTEAKQSRTGRGGCVILSLVVHCLACRDAIEKEPEEQCEIRLWICLRFFLFSLRRRLDWQTPPHRHRLLSWLWASFI